MKINVTMEEIAALLQARKPYQLPDGYDVVKVRAAGVGVDNRCLEITLQRRTGMIEQTPNTVSVAQQIAAQAACGVSLDLHSADPT